MDECTFCKIMKGEIPCSKLYEDELFIAFLDIAPANKGHALVVPKEHYETTEDTPEEILCLMMAVVKKLAAKISSELKTDGYNIFMNNKKAAGQLVPHLHCHIVPRFEDDGIDFDWPHLKYEDREMESFRDKLKL